MTARKNLARPSGVRPVIGLKKDVEPAGGVHERSDLDRHADALATLCGFVRRGFMRGVR